METTVAGLLLFLAATYLVPFLGVMPLERDPCEPGLGQYKAALGDPLVLTVFWRTLRICAVVTVAAVAAAYVITYSGCAAARCSSLIVEDCAS